MTMRQDAPYLRRQKFHEDAYDASSPYCSDGGGYGPRPSDHLPAAGASTAR